MHRSLAIVLLASACAQGGLAGREQKTDAAVDPPHDSQHVVTDAGVVHAAPKLVDEFVPKAAPPDSGGGGLFCNGNSDCTTAGECCVILGSPPGICAPGQIILGACIPN